MIVFSMIRWIIGYSLLPNPGVHLSVNLLRASRFPDLLVHVFDLKLPTRETTSRA